MLDYNKPKQYFLEHHACRLTSNCFYSIFIIGDKRFTVKTEGDQEQALKEAFNNCLAWIETFIKEDSTYIVRSNCVPLASVLIGGMTFIDAKNVQELEEQSSVDLSV